MQDCFSVKPLKQMSGGGAGGGGGGGVPFAAQVCAQY